MAVAGPDHPAQLEISPPLTLHADLEAIEIYADPLLRKVFYNLLDNSLRHGEHVSHIRVSSTEVPEGLVILWEDDGIGIPPLEKEIIFERAIGRNTGLGLFLVREILLITGITIRENGEAGTGARFEITVPKEACRFTGS